MLKFVIRLTDSNGSESYIANHCGYEAPEFVYEQRHAARFPDIARAAGYLTDALDSRKLEIVGDETVEIFPVAI